MKPIQLLPLCTAPTLLVAHELHSHVQNAGLCHSPLLGSFPLLSSPVCSSDTLLTKYQAVDSHSLVNRAWTRASSCTANGTEEYCIFTSSTFANGRGISVITSPERAEYIANLPVFADQEILKDYNKDPGERAKFRMVHVPGKDVGVVATEPFQRGDHIMSFTAAIIIDYAAFENLPSPDVRRLQAEAIELLPHNLRTRFMNLSTHDGASEYLEKVDKILSTNAFDVEIKDEKEESLYVVFPEISRFNHDCRPNADYYFDPDTLAQHVHAIRPIQIGEEISLTYLDPTRSTAKRLAKLKHVWGFDCGCSACNQRKEMISASDKRLAQMDSIRKHLEDYTGESAATPQMADLFVSLYQQERLDSSIYEAYTFAAIEWNGVGEPWAAVKYAMLAIEWGLASVGPKDPDVKEMERLVKDPWDHWSWLLRTSKRMGWGKMKPVKNNYMRGADEEEE